MYLGKNVVSKWIKMQKIIKKDNINYDNLK